MEQTAQKKGFIQFLKFNLVSASVSIIQLVLVNLLLLWMRSWNAPLPGLLNVIFSEEAVGVGNSRWGYVLPFFLSNLIANLFGYLLNKKATFNSDAPHSNMVIFGVVMILLILCSTWLQGRTVFLIRQHIPSLEKLAPTIAALLAGAVQFAIIFPLEKFVLLKERKK